MAGYIVKNKLKPTSDGRVSSWTAYVEAARTPDGQRRKLKKTFATRREADAWRIAQLSAKAKGKLPSSPGTFDDLTKRWLQVKRSELKASAFHSYEQHVRSYLSRLGRRKVDKLGSSDFTALYAELIEEGLSASTVRSIHATARACYTWALEQEPPLVDRNVVSRAKPPRRSAPEMTAWTGEEIASIIASCDLELGVLARLIASTGLRRGEAAGLRWDDVDLETGKIRIRQTLVPSGAQLHLTTPKTEASRRAISIQPALVEVLRERRHRQALERVASGKRPGEFGDLVFTKADGASAVNVGGVSREFAAAVKRAGVRHGRLHDLRHSFATIALTGGQPLVVVSKALGHSQPSTTLNIYAHALPDGVEQAVAVVSDAIEGGT